MFDGEAFGQQMVEIVRGYVAAELEPLKAENKALADRVAELEARELVTPAPGSPGRDGADCDMEAVERMIADAVAALPPAQKGERGEPGRSVGLELILASVREPIAEEIARQTGEQIAEAVKALPPPEKGEPGKDGRDVDMAEVAGLIEQGIKSAVDALPAPKDGERGSDGLGLADALIDRDGGLVLTMTDGTTKALGLVVGKDGAPGCDGVDGHTFTLDDFEIVPMDERTIKMGFTYGDVMHSFELALPIVIYRGVWREGETYQRGDMVTWAGSIWHCDRDGSLTKPDGGDFTLAVKRGRDGKDATK